MQPIRLSDDSWWNQRGSVLYFLLNQRGQLNHGGWRTKKPVKPQLSNPTLGKSSTLYTLTYIFDDPHCDIFRSLNVCFSEEQMPIIRHVINIAPPLYRKRSTTTISMSFSSCCLLEPDSNFVHLNSFTYLYKAVDRGNKDAAEVLLSRGADPNARLPGGITCLQTASVKGHQELVGFCWNTTRTRMPNGRTVARRSTKPPATTTRTWYANWSPPGPA